MNLNLSQSDFQHRLKNVARLSYQKHWSVKDNLNNVLGLIIQYEKAVEKRSEKLAKKSPSKNWQGNITFLNANLTADERNQVSKWLAEDAPIEQLVQSMLDENYRVAMSWDERSGMYIASATCKDDESPNSMFCLTARGKSFWIALGVLAWKHIVKSKKNWKRLDEIEIDEDFS